MAIDLSLNIQYAQSGGSTDTVVTKPTGTVDGDFLLAWGEFQAAQTLSPPDGWTAIGSVYTFGYGEYKMSVWYKRASGEGSTYTFTTSGSSYSEVAVWRITGVVASGDPQDATLSNNQGDGTAFSSTGITTGSANSAVIQLGVTNNDYSSLGSTTLTERLDNGLSTFAAGNIQASAGGSGNKTGTLGTERNWATFLIALKEAAGGASNTENISGSMGRPAGSLTKTVNLTRSISGEL